MRTFELRIMIVVMIVGAAPDAAGAERVHSENLHEDFSHARLRQNGMMLLIVVDHEQPQDQQAFENAAGNPCDHRKSGKSSDERGCKENACGHDVPPTSAR